MNPPRTAGAKTGHTPLRILVIATLVVGAAMIDRGLRAPTPPPQPTARQGFQTAETGGSSAFRPAGGDSADDVPHRAMAPLAAFALRAATPTRVRIPTIGVDAPLIPLDLGADHHLDAPPEDNGTAAGWYSRGATPGASGTAVIAGHVDTREGPAVFYRLGGLQRGDAVNVDRADGTTAIFVVDAVEAYPAAVFPSAKVYDPTMDAELRLITCGAGFDKAHQKYLGNVVAFAHLTSSAPIATAPTTTPAAPATPRH